MSDENPGKIEIGSRGLGLPDRELVEQRARELARMDGRDGFTQGDLVQAREEILGSVGERTPPETSEAGTGNLVAWDRPTSESGQEVPRRGPDDEQILAERLVQEGVEEAEHNLRLSASEEMEAADEE